jgi:hypothetical protein
MNLHYFLSCTLAAGSLVISPELGIPARSDTRGAQMIPVAEVAYDASVVSCCVKERRGTFFQF